jgi:hypothetical protein
MRKLDVVENNTQILRTPYSVTNTNQQSKHYSGNQLRRRRQEARYEHVVAMETSVMFGKKAATGTTGDNPRRTCEGLISRITTGGGTVTAVGGALTEQQFNNFLETVSRYGSQKKFLLASPKMVTVLDTYGRNRLQGNEGMTKKLGLKCSDYMNSHLELTVVKHNLLEGSKYGGYAVLMDPKYVKWVWMKGRKTAILRNRQNPGQDGIVEEMLSEFSLCVSNPETMGILTGITGAA